MAFSEQQATLKQQFLETRLPWSSAWESILKLDPTYFETYVKWATVPITKRHLPPKIQELIHISVNAAATHLYTPGIRAHIQSALALGATSAEIMEVLELTSTLGIHACNIGVPLLMDVLKEAGLRTGLNPLDEYRSRLKADFTANRGYWHAFWDEFLDLDPEFFEAYLAYSSVPWKQGVLEPRYKELVYCAFDCAATHLYVPGLRLHMVNALGLGATPEMIMEVLEIASLLSVQAVTVSVPILVEELVRSGEEGGGG